MAEAALAGDEIVLAACVHDHGHYGLPAPLGGSPSRFSVTLA
jgi:hypothetical protein